MITRSLTRATLGAFCIATSVASIADTEFEGSIPVEIAEALFDAYGDNQFAVYSDLADGFPELPIPSEFSVVGSVYQMSSLRVVFETELDENAALQSMSEMLESQQWISFPSINPPMQEVGFISPRQINLGRTTVFCHDELGNMRLRYMARDSGNYLSANLGLVRSRQQGDCEQQFAMQQASFRQMSRSVGLRQYLPRMEIPEDQNLPRTAVFMMGGSSSSNNSVETDGMMSSTQDIETVYEFFADQIEDQGWELDSEAIGSLSASGTWTNSPEPGLNLLGRLSVLSAGENEYELQFRLTADGFPQNGGIQFNQGSLGVSVPR